MWEASDRYKENFEIMGKERNSYSETDMEKRKTCAYMENIGKYYNMILQIFEDELNYICHDGMELRHILTETSRL